MRGATGKFPLFLFLAACLLLAAGTGRALAQGGPGDILVDEALSTPEGQQVLSTFSDAMHAYQRGDFAEATRLLRQLIERRIDERILYALFVRAGHDLFQEMLQNREMSEVAEDWLQLYLRVREEIRSDPDTIDRFIRLIKQYLDDQSTDNFIAYQLAQGSLVRLGENISSQVIDEFFLKARTKAYTAEGMLIFGELAKKNRQGVMPLIAGLEAEELSVRQHCAIALGLVRARRAVPRLRRITEDPEESDETKRIAREALLQILNQREEEMATAVEYYYHLAEDYYYENPRVLPLYETALVLEGLDVPTPIWYWNPDTRRVESRPVPAFAYNDELGLRACREGLELSWYQPFEPLMTLYLQGMVSHYLEAQSLIDTAGRQGRPTGPYSGRERQFELVNNLSRAVGVKYLYRALDRALRDGDVDVAIYFIRRLAEVADGTHLPRPPVPVDPMHLWVASRIERVTPADESESGLIEIEAIAAEPSHYLYDADIRAIGGEPELERMLTIPAEEMDRIVQEWEEAGRRDRPHFHEMYVMRVDPARVETKGNRTVFKVREVDRPLLDGRPGVVVFGNPIMRPLEPGETLLVVDPARAQPEATDPEEDEERLTMQDRLLQGGDGEATPVPGEEGPAMAERPRTLEDVTREAIDEADRVRRQLAFGYPLIDALNFPDKRIAFEAALALAEINPRQPFWRAERVCKVLARAITETRIHSVIVIDPDMQFRNRLRTMLASYPLNYIMYDAPTAREGLALAQRFPADDLIIMNVALQDINSHELFLTLRENDLRTREIPIIMLTDQRNDRAAMDHARRLFGDRVNGWLDKSVTELPHENHMNELQQVIEQALGGRGGDADAAARAADYGARAADALAALDVDHTVLTPHDAVEAMIAALNLNPDLGPIREDNVRTSCISALGHLGREDGLPAIIENFRDQRQPDELRVACLEAIGSIIHAHERDQTPAEFQLLSEVLANERQEDLVWQAAHSLGLVPTTPRQKHQLLLENNPLR